VSVRAVRGATQVDADDRDRILQATTELVNELMAGNGLMIDDVITVSSKEEK
jgi:chorismate mutase